MSNFSVEQVTENISAIRSELSKSLPGGDANIKSIHLKSTWTLSLPVYKDTITNGANVNIANNITPLKKKSQEKKMLKKDIKEATTERKKNRKFERIKILKALKEKLNSNEAKSQSLEIKRVSSGKVTKKIVKFF